MQKQRFKSATVGGNSGAVLRVEDAVPRPGSAVKRAHIEGWDTGLPGCVELVEVIFCKLGKLHVDWST